MTEKDRAEFNEWVSKMEHHDINWKPMWDFPTVAEDKKIKDRPLVVMTDMGYVFSAFYDGRGKFALASIRNCKVEYDTIEKKSSLIAWAFIE